MFYCVTYIYVVALLFHLQHCNHVQFLEMINFHQSRVSLWFIVSGKWRMVLKGMKIHINCNSNQV